MRFAAIGLVVSLLVIGCGDDGPTSPSGDGPPDIAGFWSATAELVDEDCSFGVSIGPYSCSIAQSGNSITMALPEDDLTGTVSNQGLINASGSETLQFGEELVEKSVTGVGNVISSDRIEMELTRNFSGPSFSCYMIVEYSMTRP